MTDGIYLIARAVKQVGFKHSLSPSKFETALSLVCVGLVRQLGDKCGVVLMELPVVRVQRPGRNLWTASR